MHSRRRPVRGAAGDHRAPGRTASERAPADDAGTRRQRRLDIYPTPFNSALQAFGRGPAQPVEGADRLVVELELKPKTLRVSRCIGHIGTATLPAWS